MTPEVAALMESKAVAISPTRAAKALKCTPYLLNILYKNGQLPFPAMMMGNRLKIMRIPFLRYLGYGTNESEE